ncbi:MAG: ribonuclease Z [Desulfococcaceae bacterium]
MRPSFHPRLVNPRFADPGVYIPFFFEKCAILFDAGELDRLSNRDILKTDHVFVSHTHMDHFSGFDRCLRLCLGRDKILHVYGPDGFLRNTEGKLAAYSWNLVGQYENSFIIRAAEISAEHIRIQDYPCRNRFIPESDVRILPFDGLLVQRPSFSVSAAILDHGIPCLAFCLRENFHVNIIREKLAQLHLNPGPWLQDFKQALFENRPLESLFHIPDAEQPRTFVLGELAENIALISAGQKIGYVTDAVFSPENIRKITELIKDADHLFIEAAFLDADSDRAFQKYHLTARQAGFLAGRACAGQFTLFHFSPRYEGQEYMLENEAREAYEKEIARISKGGSDDAIQDEAHCIS